MGGLELDRGGDCAALYFVRMFAITGFYHRYFSHKTYQTNRFWQFLFAVLGNSAVQRGPLWWPPITATITASPIPMKTRIRPRAMASGGATSGG